MTLGVLAWEGSNLESLGFQWEEGPEEGWSESPSLMGLVSLAFLLLVP